MQQTLDSDKAAARVAALGQNIAIAKKRVAQFQLGPPMLIFFLDKHVLGSGFQIGDAVGNVVVFSRSELLTD